MTFDLVFAPSGRLTARPLDDGREDGGSDGKDGASLGRLGAVAKAFDSSQAEGLFSLATQRFDGAPLPPAFAYWRDFACRYLADLCHTPESVDRHVQEVPPRRDKECWPRCS